MASQLSKKAALPLAKILATCRNNVSNTGPRADSFGWSYHLLFICRGSNSRAKPIPWVTDWFGLYETNGVLLMGLYICRSFCHLHRATHQKQHSKGRSVIIDRIGKSTGYMAHIHVSWYTFICSSSNRKLISSFGITTRRTSPQLCTMMCCYICINIYTIEAFGPRDKQPVCTPEQLPCKFLWEKKKMKLKF